MLKQIVSGGSIYAFIVFENYTQEGISFFTPDDFPLQLGYMNRPKNYLVEPHKHILRERVVTKSQEVLFIKSGQVKVTFFDNDDLFIGFEVLNKGDIILLADGGHSIEWLEEGEVIEIKQGPFLMGEDKIMLNKKN